MKVAWVMGGLGGGGVRRVGRDAAETVAALTEWKVSMVATDRVADYFEPPEGVDLVSLAADGPGGKIAVFREWLRDNPQDILLMNDNSALEPYWPYVPAEVALVAVLHDEGIGWRRGILNHSMHLDAVVTVSRFIEKLLRSEMPHFGGILRTVHNGCDVPPLPTGLGRRPQGRLALLYVGSMDPLRKGVWDIPRIVEHLRRGRRDYSLTMVGGQNDSLGRRLSSQLPGSVEWKGYLPHSQCLRQMAASDILLLPSRTEPFGMVTVEAMAMGCLPIAYDIESGSREIIEDGSSGFLVPLGDYGAFAERIARLREDPALLERMKRAAEVRARTQFSAERMARDYIRLIEAVMARRRVWRPLRRAPDPQARFDVPHRKLRLLLPAALRLAARSVVGRSPHLSYWLRRHRG